MKLTASLKTLSFAVMMAAASMSNAATTDWGTVAPGATFTTTFSGQRLGVFEDLYNFTLATTGDASLYRSVTLTLDGTTFTPMSGFTGLAYELYSSATNTVVASTFDALTKAYLYTGLAAGSYYLKVSGEGWIDASSLPTPAAPIYNGQVSITAAVPEPETYAMFLAGLGMLGVMARRRAGSF
jgi:hypothetical protein